MLNDVQQSRDSLWHAIKAYVKYGDFSLGIAGVVVTFHSHSALQRYVHPKLDLAFSFSWALGVSTPWRSISLLLVSWGQQLLAECSEQFVHLRSAKPSGAPLLNCRLAKQFISVREMYCPSNCLVVMVSLLQRRSFLFLTPISRQKTWGQMESGLHVESGSTQSHSMLVCIPWL